MDIVVIVIVIAALAVMMFKKFSSFVYYVGIVDIFLRTISFIFTSIKIPILGDFFNTYFPGSIFDIVRIYTDGIFETVLVWCLVVIYAILDVYLIRIFFKKK